MVGVCTWHLPWRQLVGEAATYTNPMSLSSLKILIQKWRTFGFQYQNESTQQKLGTKTSDGRHKDTKLNFPSSFSNSLRDSHQQAETSFTTDSNLIEEENWFDWFFHSHSEKKHINPEACPGLWDHTIANWNHAACNTSTRYCFQVWYDPAILDTRWLNVVPPRKAVGKHFQWAAPRIPFPFCAWHNDVMKSLLHGTKVPTNKYSYCEFTRLESLILQVVHGKWWII